MLPNKYHLSRRGVANLGKEVIGFVSAGIAGGVGLLILNEVKTAHGTCDTFNATGTCLGSTANITLDYAETGVTNIVKFMGIIGLIIAAVYIISYLVGLRQQD